MAMGGAYTALADDIDGTLVNPAGISNLEGQQVIATFSALYIGLSDNSLISDSILGYAYQRENIGTLGIVWKRFATGGLYSENTLSLSLARTFGFHLDKGDEGEDRTSMRPNLSFGATMSLLNWDSAPTVGANGRIVEDLPGWTGFGFDIGLMVWPSENTPVAISLQNVNRPDIASGVSEIEEKLPMATRMGVAAIGENVTWAMDMVLQHGQIDLLVGLERRYDQGFIVRAGFSLENLAWGTNLTFGAGYKPSDSVRIDYAFVYPVNTIANTLGNHRISVVYDF